MTKHQRFNKKKKTMMYIFVPYQVIILIVFIWTS